MSQQPEPRWYCLNKIGMATMAAPDFGIKAHRLYCPERVGDEK